ncbi:MAG: 23S rRNA (pseudouridine(1915)-N(3))-methyltransferase RlmH [Clostridiales bacterium]|nr:23S rRNA (pseudouridine(1915)-N(3))-methyltransferase RlmH [Clostridiales bacterium]
MVKINIVCVGKIKEDYFASAVQEYLKRLNRFAKVSVIEVKERNITQEPSQGEILEILKREGEEIKKHLSGYVIALAIEGEKVSSESFSKKIQAIKDKQGEITFIIGGSYGIDSSVKALSNEKISFSAMTFPHTLMRVILVEQIYRAFTIMEDGKYHK